MSGHAKYAASSASRWMTCGKSVTIDTSEIPEKTSVYAERGSYLHTVAEDLLSVGATTAEDLSLDEQATVTEYVNLVRSRRGFKLYEVQGYYIDGLVGGTADAVVYDPDARTLEVIDLKTGSGLRVEAEGNLQTAIYALAVLRNYAAVFDQVERVALTICQPPLENVSTWVLTPEELRALGDNIRYEVNQIEAGQATFAPSEDACRWCPARSICPALGEKALEAAREELLYLPNALSAAEWAEKLELVPAVRAWCEAVEAQALGRVLEGKPVPGFKAVGGRRGNRTWSDQKKARDLLVGWGFDETEVYTDPKMITPSQAEKLLKTKSSTKDVLAVRKTVLQTEAVGLGKPGPPTLAREDDKRPAYDPTDQARRDFADALEKE